VERRTLERRAALTGLKVGMYLAVVFALLAVWLVHWAVGLALLLPRAARLVALPQVLEGGRETRLATEAGIAPIPSN
jgi:hypothetical protein